MLSYARYVACPVMASTFVIAPVSVVLPWSTCPIVPTLQCGFVLSNFAFAILPPYLHSDKTLFTLYLRHNPFHYILRHLFVPGKLHGVGGPPLGLRPQVGSVPEHLCKGYHGPYDLCSA